MDDTIRTVLDQMAEKSRSKLEPHADVIRELRRKGRTYQEIAEFFSERFDLKVAPSTIHAFVRVRARRHQRLRIELPPPNLRVTVSMDSDRPTTEDISEVKKKIEALKRRPLIEQSTKPRFEYDEDQPLQLVRKDEAAQR
jgi:DNA-binding transcriptional MerR regulator